MGEYGGNPDNFLRDFQRKQEESHHNNLNSKILLTAIVSLSIVLVLVFALHLYARCFLRRQARRRAIHHLSVAVAHHSSGDQPNNTGLDPTLVASLPTFVFKRKDKSQQAQSDDEDDSSVIECSVCLSNLEDEETVRLLPNCKHVFHVGCIDTWLASHSTCPVCRTLAQPLIMIEPQPREGPAGLARSGGDHDAPMALPMVEPIVEGTSDGGAKINGSNSRLSSFRRILSRERSSRRIQPASSSQDDNNGDPDLERQ